MTNQADNVLDRAPSVHLDPEFEDAVERLATFLARDDNDELDE